MNLKVGQTLRPFVIPPLPLYFFFFLSLLLLSRLAAAENSECHVKYPCSKCSLEESETEYCKPTGLKETFVCSDPKDRSAEKTTVFESCDVLYQSSPVTFIVLEVTILMIISSFSFAIETMPSHFRPCQL